MGRPRAETYYQYIDGVAHRLCTACKQLLSLDLFPLEKRHDRMVASCRCRVCTAARYRARTDEQQARYLANARARYDPAAAAQDYQDNKEWHRAKNRRYTEKPEVKARKTARYSTDVQFKVASVLRGRLRVALAWVKAQKTGHTLDLLGCTIDDFIKHIEAQWESGMSWQNHGRYRVGGPMTWHVDHIRPCASFDLTDPAQQRACFHWSNMQPLWADDNHRKGCTLPP